MESSSLGAFGATATVQPWWVQAALKATTFPAAGWAMMMCAPLASLAATAPPTGTVFKATSTFPVCPAGGATEDVPAVDETVTGAVDDTGVVDVDDTPGAAGKAGDDDPAGEAGAAATGELLVACPFGVVAVLPAAVLELPHAATVTTLTPRPAAISTSRRFLDGGQGARPASWVERSSSREAATADGGIMQHHTQDIRERFPKIADVANRYGNDKVKDDPAALPASSEHVVCDRAERYCQDLWIKII